ncbi:siphovirus ReqiPepy6 Gp37-like family protein [Faecalimicrobium sp. JNUCC 81]
MKSIRIFDKNINLLGEIDNYKSLNITRRFYKNGEFELTINTSKLHTDKLVKNNLILFGKDFNKVGIILHRGFDYSQGQENTDLLSIKGYLLQGLMNRRLIIPDINNSYMSFKGTQEEIIKSFVYKNCVNPVDPKRKINRLVIAENKNRGANDSWRSSYELLGSKLNEIGEYSGLGWNIELDIENKQFVFDILESKNKTVNQSDLPPITFRSDFNNILTRQYTESIINSKNVVYSGTKEDSTKMVLSAGNITDFERIETFVDTNSDEVSELTKSAQVALKDLEELKTFELDVNYKNTFIYEKDYDLGDIVTVQDKKLNVTMYTKIVEVKENYTPNSMAIQLVFGKGIPNFLNRLLKAVR